jgi:hypothetical protein
LSCDLGLENFIVKKGMFDKRKFRPQGRNDGFVHFGKMSDIGKDLGNLNWIVILYVEIQKVGEKLQF